MMDNIPDDPIIRCMEDTGYPPWFDLTESDEEDEEDELPPCTMTWAEIYAHLDKLKGGSPNAEL